MLVHPTLRARLAAPLLALVVLSGCAGPVEQGSTQEPAAPASAAPAEVTAMSPGSGGVAGGAEVVLTGTGLDAVRAVEVDGVRVEPLRRAPTEVAFTLPPAEDFKADEVTVALVDAEGATVAEREFAYEVESGLDKQLRYVLKYWKNYNPKYQRLGDTDCVNFTSQAMLRRGWEQQGTWTHAENVLDAGPAWRSSTAMRDFLLQHPELATPLTDDERDRVKLGDIVQFDWDRSGDRDHTGVVTRVEQTADGVKIAYAGHTKDSDYRDVDVSITKDHPGGTAHYWSVK